MTAQPMPEKHLQTQCGQMLGGGIMSYRCYLPMGHDQIPPDDPEPCYASEARGSVVRWQTWKARQEAKVAGREPDLTPEQIVCPDCSEGVVTVDGETASCDTCDGVWPVATAKGGDPRPPEVPADFFAPAAATIVKNPDGTPWVPEDRLAERGRRLSDEEKMERLSRIHPQPEPFEEEYPGKHPEGSGFKDPVAVEKVEDSPSIFIEEQQEVPIFEGPTKTREGDQPLPGGGIDCVQDAVIAAMEDSKRVGIQRYSSVLKTFNGRKGFQDVIEEARDFFVYGTQILMEAEADRETLVKVVANRLREVERTANPSDLTHERIAATVVDAVMGWVVGQKISGESDESAGS